MDPNTFPTKGNLILAKNSLALSKQGFDLMDKKRNILIKELMELVDQAKDIHISGDRQRCTSIIQHGYFHKNKDSPHSLTHCLWRAIRLVPKPWYDKNIRAVFHQIHNRENSMCLPVFHFLYDVSVNTSCIIWRDYSSRNSSSSSSSSSYSSS